jgi:hypothetical protein
MADAACPFCFQKVNTSALAYQCAGIGSMGVRCKKKENEKWKALTGATVEQFTTFTPSAQGRNAQLTCPECKGPAMRRACPKCLRAVPRSFIDSSSPMIGVIGSKGSGKTVFMTVLIKQLRDEIGRRFGASIMFEDDAVGEFKSVLEYTREREDRLFKEGRLPTGTESNAQTRRQPIVIGWQAETSGRFGASKPRTTPLAFIDSAGEDFDTLEDAYSLQYLSACDGLMVALDPFGLPGARALTSAAAAASSMADLTRPLDAIGRVTQILQTNHHVKNGKKIKVPLAVVFTKIDAFFPVLGQGNPVMSPSASSLFYSEVDGQSVHEHMKALLTKWGADDIDRHLSFNYETYRFFGASALGAEPIYAEDRVAPGGVRPHRVQDPFLWLLARKGIVRAG